VTETLAGHPGRPEPSHWPWTSDPRVRAVRDLQQTFNALSAALTPVLRSSGIGLLDFQALVCLADEPNGRMRMGELADSAGVTLSGVTRLVDRMERGQLICRDMDPGDRRATWAVLTPTGRDRLAAVLPAYLAVVESLFLAMLGSGPLGDLLSSLDTIRRGAGARPGR
jgi:MarR family 2-MHQ and catechol resistance regulon transcriptional repressor